MTWPAPLPISTPEDAIEYGEGCARSWQQACEAPHPLTHAEWASVQLPDEMRLTNRWRLLVRDAFTRRCGWDNGDALCQWLAWGRTWFSPPRTWIEDLEQDLRDYDDILRDLDEDNYR